MLKGVKERNKTNCKVEKRRKKIMREPIKLCKCGTSPKIISNVDSFLKRIQLFVLSVVIRKLV